MKVAIYARGSTEEQANKGVQFVFLSKDITFPV